MAVNDFQVFAGAPGANVLSQAAYAALQARVTGYQTGTAASNSLNKVWRQNSIISSMIGQFIADQTGADSIDDGTIATLEANFIRAVQGLGNFAFDLGNPPNTDINLQPGGRVTMTYSNATSIPLHIATVPGVYRVTWVASANNSQNTDIRLAPNNAVVDAAPNGISAWTMANSDLYFQSIGGVSVSMGTGNITADPFIGIPTILNPTPNGTASAFTVDLFDGPNTSDTVNDRGPFMTRWLLSTYTATKSALIMGSIIGGPSLNYGRWINPTTPWTSLGTFSVGTGTAGVNALTSGSVITERLV